MSAAVETVLSTARAELNTEESPRGSNKVKYNTWYYGREVSGDAYPWCAVFVSWVAERAGATDIIPRHAYTPSGANWFKQRGAWFSRPQVGDIVFYHWAGMNRISHVGIVEAVHGDGSFTAIEGNTDGSGSRTGGRVMRQRRSSVGKTGGFGRPAYGNVAPPAAPSAPAGPRELNEGDSGQDVRDLQTRLNELGYNAGAVDGDFGPATKAAVSALQRAGGAAVDGVVGPQTRALLAAGVRAPAPAPAPVPAPPQGPNLAVDGDFGPATIRALQAVTGAAVDGDFGPNSKRALQRHLGVTADGAIGPKTIRALQQRAGGTAVDGQWGPNTTRALQRALNERRF